MDTNFEQRKKAVWVKVQKELEFFASPDVKAYIDGQAGLVQDSADLESYEGTVRSFLFAAQLQAKSQCLPPQKINPNKSKKISSRTYQRPLQNRLYLVDFVISHHLTMKTRKDVCHRRFNWKQLCDDWNTAHPYDKMTRPVVLKATYFRAAADSEVQKTILIKQAKLLQQSLEKALDERWIDQTAINNLRMLLQMPKNNMPSSFKAKYHDFAEKMADALESIYRD